MHFSMHQYIHSHPQNINHCRVIRYPGARELNGAVDLISHYKLDPQHEFFCRRPLPGPISETHYLHNIPGDTEIRRGAGMELDQLFNPNLIPPSFPPPSIHSFNIDSLRHAFSFRDAAPVCLPPVSCCFHFP